MSWKAGHMLALVAAAGSMLLTGCDQQGADEVVEPAPTPARQWVGRWTGPEGTYLDIALADASYQVTIRDLDAARTFAATPGPEGLAFERDGAAETIRATDGPGTGMKWLTDKADCLVVRPGEGFCRD